MSVTSLERDVVRILFILHYCGDRPFQSNMFDSEQYARCIESELSLQKVDFWVRYPDHLASALLRECRVGRPLAARCEEIKGVVRRIFADEEPDIRWTQMLRFRHGAYEPLDLVMSYLDSRRLAERRSALRGGPTRYYLTERGREAVEHMLEECSESRWYAERCQLISSFFGTLRGEEQRQIQYEEQTYGDTPWMQPIPRVDAAVRALFEEMFGEPL
jgi:hypothetical protein